MITLRKSDDRGHADHGGLDSYHTFSFADYFDPAHIQYGALRVINEDVIAPGQGFGMRAHRDMEIVTYMLDGMLEHKDSMGNSAAIRPGDVQRLSAGTGLRHSAFNPSKTEAAHLLQIWILPRAPGGAPGYEQKHCDVAARRGRLCRIVSGDRQATEAVQVQQDIAIHAGLFEGEESATYHMDAARKAYVQVARGSLWVNGQLLFRGDALMIEDENAVIFSDGQDAEILLFDLPAV